MNELIVFLEANAFFIILLYTELLDIALGVLRAIKEHKFNSCVGIDGAIRKVAMLLSVVFLMFIDSVVKIDFLCLIPKEYLSILRLGRVGVCELFCLLFISYEIVSILKNMTLCGLPVPEKIRSFVKKFLENMTEELPKEAKNSENIDIR